MKLPIKNLYGLVLTGGESRRMKQDKAALKFHGQTQTEFGVNLLAKFCEKVFISNRKEQKDKPGHKGFTQIHDRDEYSNIGPLGGILSALAEYPNAAWLVLACDLPFVKESTMETLLEKRNSQKIATAYISTHDNLPEPLCAIYEPAARAQLLKFFKTDIHCPRKIMINSAVELLAQNDKTALENINNPDEFDQALKVFKKK